MNTTRLQQKTCVLSEVILLTQKLYADGGLNESQKGLMETLIGAGIWYLPSSKQLYSGYISKKAYESVMRDPLNTKLVEEHAFPRKVAGQYLYSQAIAGLLSTKDKTLEKLYLEKFGRYNLVLKSENDKLKQFQKKGEFINEETAYLKAGIELVTFTADQYKEYKRVKAVKKKKL